MSKMGSYVLEMEEAARDLTRSQFEKTYGKFNLSVWDRVNIWFDDIDQDIIDSEFAAMEEGYHG